MARGDPIHLASATDSYSSRRTANTRSMTGADYWTVAALPHDQLQDVLRRHGMLAITGVQRGESPK